MSNEYTLGFIAIVALFTIWLVASNAKKTKAADHGRVQSLLEQANAAKLKGDYEHEEYLLNKAVELLADTTGSDLTIHSSILINLADAYTRQGKYSEARSAGEKLLQRWEPLLSAENMESLVEFDYFVATADFGSASVPMTEFYKRVVERKKQVFGSSHPEVGNSLLLYSKLLSRIGEKQMALDVQAEAEALKTGAKKTEEEPPQSES